LLDGILLVFTVFIGWIIWSLIIWSRGQSPAKQLLGMRVVSLRENKAAGWGTMFVREVIAKPVIGILAWFTLGIINFWLIWDKNKQQLWDKMVGTIVVSDPQGQLAPGAHQLASQQTAPQ
jgi:uncharacterized RDD family membrane protein YckC